MYFEKSSTSSRFCEESCKIKIVCKLARGYKLPVDSCRKPTKSPSSSFLQDTSCLCNLATDAITCGCKETAGDHGRLSIFIPCISGRFCWVSRYEDWLPTFFRTEVHVFLRDHQYHQNRKTQSRAPINFEWSCLSFKKGLCIECRSWCKKEIQETSEDHYLTFLISTQHHLFGNGNAR
jgi:hypothetical protein